MKHKEEFQVVKLRGIITAAEWDEDNKITTFKLSTQDEKEYFIEYKKCGKKPGKFNSQYVEITGVVEENEYGEKLIVPQSYEVIKDC
jgi:hypothetical protein